MTLGMPPKSIGIRIERDSSSSLEGRSTHQRYYFTTEYAVTTNSESVEHTETEEDVKLAYVTDTPTTRRSKASTLKTNSLQSIGTSPPDNVSEGSWDREERGRTRTRHECIVPPRSRRISRRNVKKRVGNSSRDSRDVSPGPETFLTSESPSPSNSSKEEHGDLILEPSPPHNFARTFSERLSETTSPASPEEGVPFPHEDYALHHRRSAASPDSRSLSMIEPAHFQNHRDTFAILQLPKYRPPPRSAIELSNIPYPILKHVDQYLDLKSRLALRSTCKWLRDSMVELHPTRAPAVSNMPAELIHQVLSNLSPFDFNSARHTCRAWMRVSLDKNLLARMFRKAGWWTSVEQEMRAFLSRTGVDEDDFNAVWHLSSLFARECALSPWWNGKGLPDPQRIAAVVLKRAQVDGAADEGSFGHKAPSPFELTLETDYSALCDAGLQANAVQTYAQARGLREGVHFTASICGRFVLVTNGSQIFIYRLSHTIQQQANASDGRSPFGADFPAARSSCKTAIIYPVTTLICPRRVLAVSMDTSCGRYAVAALLDDRMGLVCDLFGSGESSPVRGWSSEVRIVSKISSLY